MEQFSRTGYNSNFHKIIEKQIIKLSQNNIYCQDILVDGLGSRINRMGDRCRNIFKIYGPAGADHLIAGLAQPHILVRSQTALILRVDGKKWIKAHSQQIVPHLINTLKDERYTEAFAQTLFLIRELRPKASAALPELEKIIKSQDRKYRGFQSKAQKALKAIKSKNK